MSTTHTPETVLIPSEVDEVSVVLKKAADLIEERGWFNDLDHVDGELCALWAIETAARPYSGRPLAEKAANRLRSYVGCESIGDWNDSQTDVTFVTSALRKAAVS